MTLVLIACHSLMGLRLAMVVTPCSAILMTMKDGSLGFANLDCLTLYLWSRVIRSDGVASWIPCRVVDFKELLPIRNPKKRLRIIGFRDDSDIVFNLGV